MKKITHAKATIGERRIQGDVSDDVVSARIEMLRFLMICGIVVLHTPPYVPILEVGSHWFDLLKALFQNGVFRATVPILTSISGYLLYRAEQDRIPGRLYKKKLRTIGVPFIVFNAAVLIATFAMQSIVPVSLSYQLIPFDAMTWSNALLGLTNAPINFPLNFLRDLLIVFALAPLFGWLIRNTPVKGLILVALIFFNNLDGMLVLRSSMPVLFYVGGLAAVYRWDMRKLDRFAWPCLALFALMCASVVAFQVTNLTFLHLASPLLVWPAASLLGKYTAGRWCATMSKYSFFVFLAHAPVLSLSWLLYGRLGSAIPYPVYWGLMPILTIALLIVTYRLARRQAPRVFATLMGESAPPASAPIVGNARHLTFGANKEDCN